ncbi:MAG TPA: TonB-dependent receptor [Azoarcus taiwanensis]|nr:TonB-dependent receptor [Azoarcus taiwanensis]
MRPRSPGHRLRSQCALALLITGVSLPSGTFADQSLMALQLEELLQVEITGASRFAQNSRRAPAAASVVTRTQIQDHGWTKLSQVLDAMPDVFISTDRVYDYVGVRGLMQPSDYNTNVLLLVDGVPVNDALYNQASIDNTALIDLALVDRVEFIPGPGSSVYGSNAILGVINVVTTTGRNQRGTTVDLGVGDHGERGVAVRHGYAGDRRDLLLSASTWRSDGQAVSLPPVDGQAFGRARGTEGERWHRFTLRHAWDDFTLLATHTERKKGYSTAPYATVFGDERTRAKDRRWMLALAHEREWAPGLSVKSGLSFNGHHYRGEWAFDPDESVSRDDAEGRWWTLEAQATDTRIAGHTLVYGFEHRNEFQLNQRYYELGPPRVDYLNDRRSAHHSGAYVQDEWRQGAWLLNAGVRVDHYSSFGNTINPRLALIRELDEATTLKLLFGSAYRAPNVYELYYDDGNIDMKANPELDPVRVRSAEAVLEHHTTSGWQWRGSLFHSQLLDMIGQERDADDGLLVYRNRGDARINGLTVVSRKSWLDGRRLSLSATWSDTRLRNGGERLTHSPRLVAKGDATLPIGNWRATLETRYVGARTSGRGRIGSQAWANLALTTHQIAALPGARITLRVDNLFDRKLFDPASDEFAHDRLPREGRHARLTISWTF